MTTQRGIAETLGARATGLRLLSVLLETMVTFFRRKPLGATGGVIIVLLVVAAIFAPQLAPADPHKVNSKDLYHAPGKEYLLGSDQIGRDVLSRLIYGARISMYVGLTSVFVGATLGTLVGIVTAYFGGVTDLLLQRILDAMMSIPAIILAMAIMAGLGISLTNVVIALTIVFIPSAARTMRSRALSLKEMDFVLAARAVGAGHWRIMYRHILPNCISLYIVFISITMGFAIVLEASLSFLGVGAPPEEPSWGGMLNKAATQYVNLAPWLALSPGITIAVVVYAFNMLGDALRDVLDPRLRGT